MPPKHRDVSPFFQLLRDFLLGRKHVTCLRRADNVSSRDTPGSAAPDPFLTRLAGKSYYLRDPRSVVKPPVDLIMEKKRKLAAEAAKAAAAKAAAEEAAKNPGKDSKADAKPSPSPAPKAAAPSSSCKQDASRQSQSKPRRTGPILGRVHKWD